MNSSRKVCAFKRKSKRRKGYPSGTCVKRGQRIVHGDKELLEKPGKEGLCPCGSGRHFQRDITLKQRALSGPCSLELLLQLGEDMEQNWQEALMNIGLWGPPRPSRRKRMTHCKTGKVLTFLNSSLLSSSDRRNE